MSPWPPLQRRPGGAAGSGAGVGAESRGHGRRGLRRCCLFGDFRRRHFRSARPSLPAAPSSLAPPCWRRPSWLERRSSKVPASSARPPCWRRPSSRVRLSWPDSFAFAGAAFAGACVFTGAAFTGAVFLATAFWPARPGCSFLGWRGLHGRGFLGGHVLCSYLLATAFFAGADFFAGAAFVARLSSRAPPSWRRRLPCRDSLRRHDLPSRRGLSGGGGLLRRSGILRGSLLRRQPSSRGAAFLAGAAFRAGVPAGPAQGAPDATDCSHVVCHPSVIPERAARCGRTPKGGKYMGPAIAFTSCRAGLAPQRTDIRQRGGRELARIRRYDEDK